MNKMKISFGIGIVLTVLAVFTAAAAAQMPIDVNLRAEGIAGTIFDVTNYTIQAGNVTEDGITINNQTAMGAVVVYCHDNAINIDIMMYPGLGTYLTQIGTDPADEYSWCYAVNEVIPWVGGDEYEIEKNDNVHWYNYKLNYYLVWTELEPTLVNLSENVTTTVTWKNTSGIFPLSNAEVFVTATAYTSGTSVGFTNESGMLSFTATQTGAWYVYAVDPVYGSGIYNYPPPYYEVKPISAVIDFDPDTLNLRGDGRWVTVHMELPEGYNVTNIDVGTVKLNDEVQAEAHPTKVGDYDADGIADLMVKFGRSAVQEILEVGDEIEITVTGELIDGTFFEGSDMIRVIDE